MRLLESPAGQLGIEIAPHFRMKQEPSKAESPHGFLTALLFDARKGMKMDKERNDLEFHRETRKEQTLRKSMKKRCKKKSSGWPRRRSR